MGVPIELLQNKEICLWSSRLKSTNWRKSSYRIFAVFPSLIFLQLIGNSTKTSTINLADRRNREFCRAAASNSYLAN